jgi:type VI secretion system protein VasG
VSAIYREKPDASPEEVIEAIGPALRKHFGAALIGRMHVIPYRPLNEDMLASIVRLKVQRMKDRIRLAHRLETVVTDGFVQALVSRCTTSESGARQVDQVLRGQVASRVATTLLQSSEEQLADRTLVLDWGTTGDALIELRPKSQTEPQRTEAFL